MKSSTLVGRFVLAAQVLLFAHLPAQGGVWLRVQTATSPPPRVNHVLVYDSARQVLVLHGGDGLNDTWEYGGTDWSLRSTSGPAIGMYEAMCSAYDSQRHRTVVLVGNQNGMRTWEWDGVTWLQRNLPGGTPTSSGGFRAAYDSLRGRTVLFGTNSDTYEYDGNAWQQRSSGGPTARQESSMCFDSARGVVLLFGGSTYSDTWEWNGSYWLEHFGIANPGQRTGTAIAFDPIRSRTVLYGGYTRSGSAAIGTWEWDGTAWTQITTTGQPSSDWAGAMAYDAARQRMEFFGGYGSGGNQNELWVYSVLTGPIASYTPYGQGCAGPVGVPTLAAMSGSLPHLGQSLVLQLGNLPSTPFNLPFGVLSTNNSSWNGQPLPFDLTPFGFPGCQAWLFPEASYGLANAAGTATWTIPIPFLPTLLGTNVYAQGAVLVPGYNPGSMVFSNAGHAVIGLP